MKMGKLRGPREKLVTITAHYSVTTFHETVMVRGSIEYGHLHTCRMWSQVTIKMNIVHQSREIEGRTGRSQGAPA